MSQIKISLDDELIKFVSNYSMHGYSSKSAMVEAAVLEFKKALETKMLMESAEIYQEIYNEDSELQDLTDDAASLCLD